MANWSEFDQDLLVEIARRVKLHDDFIFFGQVCTSWRSAAVLENFRYKSDQIPRLMLPPNKEDKKYGIDQCSFFSLSKDMLRHVIVPDVNSAKYFSSGGWLIKLAPDLSTSLLHPLSRRQLKLPDITTIPNWDEEESTPLFANSLWKCVLSSSSSTEDDSQLQIMVIYGEWGRLGYARPGDQVWRKITTDRPRRRFFDVIYYKHQFYVVNSAGEIYVINGDTARRVAALPPELIRGLWGGGVIEYLYMVRLDDGRLLVVSREGVQARTIEPDSEDYTYGTLGFQVFEVDLTSNKWEEIHNLGGTSLFVGHNSSLAIDASNNPNCKPNCIYFTDDFLESCWDKEMLHDHNGEGGKDMGVYSMEDGSIEPHFKGKSSHSLNPPMWVEQSFSLNLPTM